MRLTVADAGHVFVLHIKEDEPIPASIVESKPPHQEFLAWWRRQCTERNIPYQYRVAEPMGHRIILSMLKKRDLSTLKELAVQFFRDHGELLTEEPRHFMLFSAMIDQVETEQENRV